MIVIFIVDGLCKKGHIRIEKLDEYSRRAGWVTLWD